MDTLSDKEFGQLIFSYGTLVDKFPEAVVDEASLEGTFELDDKGMFPIVKQSNQKNTINGYVLSLSEAELKIADEYESGLYDRMQVEVSLKKGGSVKAQVYVEF